MRMLRAEVMKMATLPSIWVASILTVVIPTVLTVLSGRYLRSALESGHTGDLSGTSTVDEGFAQLSYGLVGVVAIGVLSISSEYARNPRTVGAGRQITTSLAAAAHRGRLVAAKLGVLAAWVALLAAVTIPATLMLSHWALGPYATHLGSGVWSRSAGLLAYWMVMALLSFAIAGIARNGVIPLTLLIANASVVSFSLLAAKVTSLARFLPDVAAYPLFVTGIPIRQHLSGASAVVTLIVWAVAAVAALTASFQFRDA